ncbi:TPA: MobC family plasmid mobilization relaxosome protein [Salmonella enterica subsp. houtenae]|nr:MobC family plasmid mobilization relaxosome protein [Salmonella enterica subsp. houtenae serovar 51:z4,z23:-]EKO1017154.1 plasmid mobilization relaxosome protein MobC [Salmonella enterica subsp. enterica]HAU3308703.1 MobC family plasmid mobilization relaxosome protein [Salmonella enterica subsp. houtenae]
MGWQKCSGIRRSYLASYREIQHQGNNINQIAKRLNANEDFKQSVAAEANFAIKQLRKRILRACEVYAV